MNKDVNVCQVPWVSVKYGDHRIVCSGIKGSEKISQGISVI
jgi:hypothetical protein